MKKSIIIATTAALLAGCGVYESAGEYIENFADASDYIEKEIGLAPHISMERSSDSLTVHLIFEGVPEKQSIPEIISISRKAIDANFEKKAEEVIVSFRDCPEFCVGRDFSMEEW